MSESSILYLEIERFDPDYFPQFEEKLFFDGEKRKRQVLNFTVLLILATVIATYGVLQDSTAAVIGAMIIAPLMTPIMACAAAATLGSSRRVAGALMLVALGVFAVIVLSLAMTLIIPGQLISLESNPQIVSRVSPGLLDLIIALAAGAAGAYAIGRQEIADSLAGVAIAISLVPPLCVVGIALAKGSLPDAGGAFLLFLTNFIAILVAGTAVFGLLRLPEAGAVGMKEATRKRAVQIIILATVLLVIGLSVVSLNTVQTIDEQITAYNTVQRWLGSAPYQINQVTVQNSVVEITLLGEGELPSLDSLARDLGQKLGRPVEVTVHLIPETSMRFPPV